MRLALTGLRALRLCLLALFLCPCCPVSSQTPDVPQASSASDGSNVAAVTVMVRDESGNPVPGLGANDFALTETGQRVSVIGVTGAAQAIAASGHAETGQGRQPDRAGSLQLRTSVLLIISPMSASGRHDAIRSALQLFAGAPLDCCQIALLDDAGIYTRGKSAVQSRLEQLQERISPPQYGGWTAAASKAIEELGLMPGRRAIIFASDYESKLEHAFDENPYLVRADPSMFVAPALRAQAAMYTVQSSGPAVVIPFGDATSQGTSSGSGPGILARLSEQQTTLQTLRSQLLYAASVTGGAAVEDIPHAFAQIQRDAEGCYTLHFRPSVEESDGDWHLLKIRTTLPQLHVSELSLYKAAPNSGAPLGLPSAVAEAFRAGVIAHDLKVDTHAWFFPDGRSGVFTLPLAVDVSWPKPAQTPDARRPVKIYAKLRNDSLGVEVGMREAPAIWKPGRAELVAHWQEEFAISPGAYTFMIVAQDIASGKVGNATYSFLVHSLSGQPVAVSSLVLADGCYSNPADTAARTMLSDPLDRNGCELRLNAEARFPVDHRITFLVRLYPASQKFYDELVKSWKARLVVADSQASAQHSTPLPIQRGQVRGLVVSGTFTASDLNLKAGTHKLAIVFEGPRHERFAAEGAFSFNQLSATFSQAPLAAGAADQR